MWRFLSGPAARATHRIAHAVVGDVAVFGFPRCAVVVPAGQRPTSVVYFVRRQRVRQRLTTPNQSPHRRGRPPVARVRRPPGGQRIVSAMMRSDCLGPSVLAPASGGRRRARPRGARGQGPIVAAQAADDWTQRAFEPQAMIPLASSTVPYARVDRLAWPGPEWARQQRRFTATKS